MKTSSTVILFLAFALLIACSTSQKKMTIGYIQITQDEVLDTAQMGVFAALRDSGYIDGQNIKIINSNAQGDLSLIPTILQSFQSQGVSLIITNGTPCMVSAAQMISDIPVVFTVSFDPDQVGMKAVPSNLYGIYDPLNATKFVTMMQESLPSLKRVGMPSNNAEPNAEYSAKTFEKEFQKRGIEVVKATVNSANDLIMVGQYLAGQRIDAMVVAADNTIYMGLNVLAKIARESKIPLFVTDPHQVKKGAAVGMGVNYFQWGYLSGLKAVELLKGREVHNHIEPITNEEMLINTKICSEIELKINPSFSDVIVHQF
jgi:putative tryptophan/tyrosine transport system substrate-binding protein